MGTGACMKEPRNRNDLDIGSSDDFRMYAGWLKNRPETPALPEFQAGWLSRAPGQALSEREMAGITGGSSGGSRIVQWGLLAAVLTLAIGGSLLYPRLFESPTEAPVAKTGKPARAMVMFVQGQAWVKVPEAAERGTLASGSVLEEGARVETGPDGRADLAFSKGSIIRINPNSSLVIENMRTLEKGRQVEVGLEQGSVLSVVERLSPGDDYTVTTPTAIAGVRGTSFRVATDGRQTEVRCHDGKLSVMRRGGADERVLGANQLVAIEPERAPEVREIAAQPEENVELETLRERLQSYDPEVVKATLELAKIKSEADIERIYQRGLETIILKDGRTYRGIVASQYGDRLIIQTGAGQLVIPLEQVKEIYQQ